MEGTLENAVGAAVGAAGLVSVMGDVPFMTVLQSTSGGLGAGLGYAAGTYLASEPKLQNSKSALTEALPLIGAIGVPYLASGQLDQTTAMLGVGAYVGGMLIKQIIAKV